MKKGDIIRAWNHFQGKFLYLIIDPCYSGSKGIVRLLRSGDDSSRKIYTMNEREFFDRFIILK